MSGRKPSLATTAASEGEGTILFGGSGFLGPHILGRYPRMVSVGRTPPQTDNRHVAIESLADLDVLRDLSFDKVIYIIGNTEHHKLEKEVVPRGEPTAFDYHVVPLLQAMEQLKQYPIKKMIHFSTILMYGEENLSLPVSEEHAIDPYRNRYVTSKYLAEEACKFYAGWIPIVNVRLSNIYGPTSLRRPDLIHVLMHQILEHGEASVWSTRPERDFIYVEDAAHAIVRLLDSDYTGTVNMGTGTMTSVREVVSILERLTGARIVDRDQPVTGPLQFRCDTTRLRRVIDWEPEHSIEEGLAHTTTS